MLRIAAFLFACCLLVTAGAGAAQNLTGTWSGMLDFSGQPLLFVIAISHTDKGLSATASSPYQGGDAIPVDSIASSGAKLTFAIPKLDVTYTGTIGGDSISGTFTQRGQVVPLKLVPSSLGTSTLDGTWLGTLSTGGDDLLLALHVQSASGNKLSATMDSPYQKGFGIPVSSIANSNGTLTFAMASINASYTGTIGPQTIAGTFTQNGKTFPLTFARPAVTAPAAAP
ncbi:MAG TPA: hypothetical protein VNG31_00380 [Candidatus Baltobacteraceae bacterium]|nr:hypothetical protein [Candidatus Baltobacteraceae bacterium]